MAFGYGMRMQRILLAALVPIGCFLLTSCGTVGQPRVKDTNPDILHDSGGRGPRRKR